MHGEHTFTTERTELTETLDAIQKRFAAAVIFFSVFNELTEVSLPVQSVFEASVFRYPKLIRTNA
jgi:hypothetical protein